MKEKINGIIVVEGKSDVALLSNYFDAEFVITNGSAISEDTILYLEKMSLSKDIYVLTDPDSPGKKIRDTLDLKIKNLKHCFIKKELSIKNGKVGVAEGNIEDIKNALSNALTYSKDSQGSLTMYDMIKLGLSGNDNSNELRKKVSSKLNLGHCNAKTFLKRANYAKIKYEELERLI